MQTAGGRIDGSRESWREMDRSSQMQPPSKVDCKPCAEDCTVLRVGVCNSEDSLRAQEMELPKDPNVERPHMPRRRPQQASLQVSPAGCMAGWVVQ